MVLYGVEAFPFQSRSLLYDYLSVNAIAIAFQFYKVSARFQVRKVILQLLPADFQ